MKRKTIELSIKDLKIIIKTPLTVQKNEVEHLLFKKKKWIQNKLKRIQNKINIQKINSRDFLNLLFLGELVETKEALLNKIVLIKKSENSERNISDFSDWFYAESKYILSQRVNHCILQMNDVSFPKIQIQFKFMKTRWGSCSSKNSISLNLFLIHTPLECIDYVIFHEFCHLFVRNHSSKFYSLLGKYSLEYKKAEKELSRYLLH